MEVIEHYVFSSRKVTTANGKRTYLTDGPANNNGKDGALPYFHIGKYTLKNMQIELPTFLTEDDHKESKDFYEYPDNFFLPKEHTSQVFHEIFSSLKESDKILYIYIHGFGNDENKEMNKQVLPMTERYYPHSGNLNSPVGKMLFITWPSQGFIEYKHGEKDDVSKMGIMLNVLMLKLFYFVNDKTNPLFENWKPKIVFHAQSMGCKILQTSIHRLNDLIRANVIKQNRLDNFFHRIVMTGADLDVDTLNDLPDEEGEEIHQLTKRLILFSNKTDFALWISRFVFSSGRRLGRHLKEEDYHLLPKNLELVKLKRNEVNFIGHNYFTDEPDIALRLQNLLKNNHFDLIELQDKMREITYNLDTNQIEEAKYYS